MFVIVGSVTADIFIFNQPPAGLSSDDGFRASNLVFTDQPPLILLGGNGGISAYVLAGLGAPTALGGAVGQDLLGDQLVSWLDARGVQLAGLSRSETQATSSSTILMSDAASQVVFHHLGSTAGVGLAEMPQTLFREAEALLCCSFPLMGQMRAGGFARALEMTQRAGGLTALDIGPAIGEPVRLDEVSPLFPHLDYLLGNSHELTTLTGTDNWQAAGAMLLSLGLRALVIKQGALGAAVRAAGVQLDVPAFSVEANISVGAGDSFNVGFLYGLRQGWPGEAAVRFASAVAALVIGSDRGALGAPSLAEVMAFLDAQTDRSAG